MDALPSFGSPVGVTGESRADLPWDQDFERGTAERLHEWRPPQTSRPTVRTLEVTAPAIVLGSSQPDDDIDAHAAADHSIEIVRRRSGGGAVLLVPGAHLWVDVWLPHGHSLWQDDVVASSSWLGSLWETTLADLGVDGLATHSGRMTVTDWSPIICFAGLGPGEITANGQKLVGVSQRRTRDWARFQCLVHRRWEPELMVELVAFDRRPVGVALPAVAVSDAEALGAAFVSHLATI